MHHRYKFKMYKEIDKFHQDLKCLQYIHVLNYHTVYLKLESESCSIMSNSLWPHGLYSPWNSPGLNAGVGSLSLLQGIFPTQWLSPGLLHCRLILYQLSQRGSPKIREWVAYSFSSRSSRPRNQSSVSCIAGRFFTNWAIREAALNLPILYVNYISVKQRSFKMFF